jgi:lipoate-protein ligase B
MINVQFKHTTFSNTLVNDVCNRHLHIVADDDNPARPDRYWIVSNTGTQLYTYGTRNRHDSSTMPAQINGIAVEPQIRTGDITYHGPGQLGWLWIINYRRLLRQYGKDLNMPILMQYVCTAVNAEFSETLQSDLRDPGLYRPTGEKILSYGIDMPGVSWMAIKLSLNLHVDLSVYNNATICGIENRAMGNLLPSLPDLNTQAQLSESITRRVWDQIYTEYQITDWAD